jgi:hypothetical protein
LGKSFENISDIFVTLLVHHIDKPVPVKVLVFTNIEPILVTLLTSQSDRSESNAVQLKNMEFMVVTEDGNTAGAVVRLLHPANAYSKFVIPSYNDVHADKHIR